MILHRAWTRSRFIPVVAIFLLASGCSDAFGPSGQYGVEQRELSRAQRIWISNDIRDYEYVLRHECFCAMGGVNVRVTVLRDVVIAREVESTGAPVPPSLSSAYPTIDGLFAFVQDAIDHRAYRVSARYDDRYGFPTDIYVDYNRNTADEEQGYTLVRFRSLR